MTHVVTPVITCVICHDEAPGGTLPCGCEDLACLECCLNSLFGDGDQKCPYRRDHSQSPEVVAENVKNITDMVVKCRERVPPGFVSELFGHPSFTYRERWLIFMEMDPAFLRTIISETIFPDMDGAGTDVSQFHFSMEPNFTENTKRTLFDWWWNWTASTADTTVDQILSTVFLFHGNKLWDRGNILPFELHRAMSVLTEERRMLLPISVNCGGERWRSILESHVNDFAKAVGNCNYCNGGYRLLRGHPWVWCENCLSSRDELPFYESKNLAADIQADVMDIRQSVANNIIGYFRFPSTHAWMCLDRLVGKFEIDPNAVHLLFNALSDRVATTIVASWLEVGLDTQIGKRHTLRLKGPFETLFTEGHKKLIREWWEVTDRTLLTKAQVNFLKGWFPNRNNGCVG